MIVIDKQEEMQKYYIKETNTYSFDDDVKFNCDIVVESSIKAHNISSFFNIKAYYDIEAWDIRAGDINAYNIKARNIRAGDIKLLCNIDANDISFNAVCFAYVSFVCNSIKGRRKKHKYFCLDSKVVIKSKYMDG